MWIVARWPESAGLFVKPYEVRYMTAAGEWRLDREKAEIWPSLALANIARMAVAHKCKGWTVGVLRVHPAPPAQKQRAQDPAP